MSIVYIVWAVAIGWLVYDVYTFNNSSYKRVTGNSYLATMFDFGRKGEYFTYKYLRKYEKDGEKFLFNAYIPKGENGTTEIDVLFISSKGLFVFESKNYSGWIFGNEKQKMWTQCLPQNKGSHKEKFFNPIMQNKTHIKHLKTLLNEETPVFSIIVFSERCTLKDITLYSDDVKVIKRNSVKYTVDSILSSGQSVLSPEDINEIYNKLYPFTQVSEDVKKAHIDAINVDISESVKAQTTAQAEQVKVQVESVQESEESAIGANVSMEAAIEEKLCPRCGQKLVLRVAKKGKNAGNEFYGCSTYPKCRYTE